MLSLLSVSSFQKIRKKASDDMSEEVANVPSHLGSTAICKSSWPIFVPKVYSPPGALSRLLSEHPAESGLTGLVNGDPKPKIGTSDLKLSGSKALSCPTHFRAHRVETCLYRCR